MNDRPPTGMQESLTEQEAQVGTDTIEERAALASQWRLMWWKFSKHKLAVIATIILGLFYLATSLIISGVIV